MAGKATLHAPTAKRETPSHAFGAPWVFVLCVIDGRDPHRVHRIERIETVVGRGGEADLQLDDGEVSKRHCLIRTEGAVCTICDLGSMNGTSLNHRPLESGVTRRLRHLDEIDVGGTRIFLLCGRHRPRTGR